ncbi:alpha/beta hydrolase family protein [Paraburkholderia caballeronis]|uniref:alpha/beta hydrolase family protein n=1 Tax=Paraburkholderia caballeronis TaxID=416943 RepID=UPI0010649FC4|nr:hypothetical protein [Paraburkholderia caballeronis]TDV06943.1 hypothetical protein C7408_12137 [Paraburkholderia caballeronis]TDV10922.1 hypothetical protein C7406_12337 [Paraburkholderia caballeronis]TDV22360.1 hypothetical protein C7404_11937 [Paraburkholderia caballeronis]
MKRTTVALAILLSATGFLLADGAAAQTGELIALPSRDGVTQPIYVETSTPNPPWVVVLFAGNDGDLHLNADGPTSLKGNFLIRSAGYWVRHGNAAVLVDTPSDHASGSEDLFRLGKESLADTQAIVTALRQRFPSSKIALVGTSRGTVSVGNALQRDPALADAYVLTSPVSVAQRGRPGVSGLDADGTKARVLVVANRHDGCAASAFASGSALAERNHFAFVAVDSTEGGGDAKAECGGHSPHGFLGIERDVLDGIGNWLDGRAPQSAAE